MAADVASSPRKTSSLLPAPIVILEGMVVGHSPTHVSFAGYCSVDPLLQKLDHTSKEAHRREECLVSKGSLDGLVNLSVGEWCATSVAGISFSEIEISAYQVGDVCPALKISTNGAFGMSHTRLLGSDDFSDILRNVSFEGGIDNGYRNPRLRHLWPPLKLALLDPYVRFRNLACRDLRMAIRANENEVLKLVARGVFVNVMDLQRCNLFAPAKGARGARFLIDLLLDQLGWFDSFLCHGSLGVGLLSLFGAGGNYLWSAENRLTTPAFQKMRPP